MLVRGQKYNINIKITVRSTFLSLALSAIAYEANLNILDILHE